MTEKYGMGGGGSINEWKWKICSYEQYFCEVNINLNVLNNIDTN